MSNPFSKKNILVLIPLIMVMLLDLTFTMAGQPKIYWQDHSLFNEGSPLGQVLMLDPFCFIAFFFFYIFFVLFLATNLKRPFNLIWGIGFYLGHVWGSSTWVSTIFYKFTGLTAVSEWYITVGYCVILAALTGVFINQWLRTKNI
jgi:hypothetical protein